MNPALQLSQLICPDTDCGDMQNITSVLLQWTGTDITFMINNIMASDVESKFRPGLSFQTSADVSLLSQSKSLLCKAEKQFCCEGPSKDSKEDVDCCCTPDNFMDVKCLHKIIGPQCSSNTGKMTTCSDRYLSTDGKSYKSDCAEFKRAIYNFTKTQDDGNVGRVSLYPTLQVEADSLEAGVADTQSLTSAASTPGAVAINIVQLFYAELCSTTIGVNRNKDRCPGCSSDNGCKRQWIFGDDMSSDTDKAAVRIGDFDHCNSLFNDFMRHFGGVWGVVGVICLLTGIVLFGGYFGFKQYRNRQDQLNYGVVNDDSIYKDVTAGAEVESVVR